MSDSTNPGPFYDHKGVAHDTMPISEDTGLPLYRATPAQPIAPQTEVPQGFIDYVRANYNGVVDIHAPEWHAKRLWNAAMHQLKVSQPIADVSAPTDERESLDTVEFSGRVIAAASEAMTTGQGEEWDGLLDHICKWAARAAAPVSGQGAIYQCLHSKTAIGVTHWNDVNKETFDSTPQAQRRVLYSRPRSEDSRAKVLEEAAKLCESDEQELEIGRCCAAAIRALATSAAPERSGKLADDAGEQQ